MEYKCPRCGAADRDKELGSLRAQLDFISTDDRAAYWEGHDEAVAGVAGRWEEALTCPIPKAGVMQEPLESLYRKTEELRAQLAAERERTKKECMEALKTYYGTGHTMVDVVLARLERRIEEL